jgi:hypothetical protein
MKTRQRRTHQELWDLFTNELQESLKGADLTFYPDMITYEGVNEDDVNEQGFWLVYPNNFGEVFIFYTPGEENLTCNVELNYPNQPKDQEVWSVTQSIFEDRISSLSINSLIGKDKKRKKVVRYLRDTFISWDRGRICNGIRNQLNNYMNFSEKTGWHFAETYRFSEVESVFQWPFKEVAHEIEGRNNDDTLEDHFDFRGSPVREPSHKKSNVIVLKKTTGIQNYGASENHNYHDQLELWITLDPDRVHTPLYQLHHIRSTEVVTNPEEAKLWEEACGRGEEPPPEAERPHTYVARCGEVILTSKDLNRIAMAAQVRDHETLKNYAEIDDKDLLDWRVVDAFEQAFNNHPNTRFKRVDVVWQGRKAKDPVLRLSFSNNLFFEAKPVIPFSRLHDGDSFLQYSDRPHCWYFKSNLSGHERAKCDGEIRRLISEGDLNRFYLYNSGPRRVGLPMNYTH